MRDVSCLENALLIILNPVLVVLVLGPVLLVNFLYLNRIPVLELDKQHLILCLPSSGPTGIMTVFVCRVLQQTTGNRGMPGSTTLM